uniref:Uncharacterized protein n=1 Tax=Panagrolaimus davidi TaxID=227884 RepID=A0A914QN90_9BILA
MYPSNPNGYQKLIKSCKYFFAKNPVLVIDYVYEGENKKWTATLNETQKYIDFTNVSNKFWIIDVFDGYHAKTFVSSIIPKLYKCDVKDLRLMDDIITFEDFLLLSSNVRKIALYRNTIKKENGEIVSLEKIVKVLDKLKFITFVNDFNNSAITLNTVKELLEIPHFSKINDFTLDLIPETFSVDQMFTYLKKNKQTKFRIQFRDTISEAYKIQLEEIVDEIIDAENHDYKIPDIYYDGANSEKFNKLHSLFLKML